MAYFLVWFNMNSITFSKRVITAIQIIVIWYPSMSVTCLLLWNPAGECPAYFSLSCRFVFKRQNHYNGNAISSQEDLGYLSHLPVAPQGSTPPERTGRHSSLESMAPPNRLTVVFSRIFFSTAG